MKLYYLLFLCTILSCNTSRKKVSSNENTTKILLVFKNPRKIENGILLLQNSGLKLEKLIVNKSNLKIGLIKTPKEETNYWIKTLESQSDFKKAILYSKKKLDNLINNEQNILLTYEKQACRGFCPVFELTIYKNRKVYFFGKSNTKIIGSKEFTLNPSEFSSLKKLYNNTVFETYKSKYVNPNIADIPMTIIGNQNKQIKITDTKNAPKSLIKIIELLNTILKSKKVYD